MAAFTAAAAADGFSGFALLYHLNNDERNDAEHRKADDYAAQVLGYKV